MAKNVMAPRDHRPPTGHVARHPTPRLQALGHWRLPFLLVRHVHNGGAWATAKRCWSWTGDEICKEEREKETLRPMRFFLFPVSDWPIFKIKKFYFINEFFPFCLTLPPPRVHGHNNSAMQVYKFERKRSWFTLEVELANREYLLAIREDIVSFSSCFISVRAHEVGPKYVWYFLCVGIFIGIFLSSK